MMLYTAAASTGREEPHRVIPQEEARWRHAPHLSGGTVHCSGFMLVHATCCVCSCSRATCIQHVVYAHAAVLHVYSMLCMLMQSCYMYTACCVCSCSRATCIQHVVYAHAAVLHVYSMLCTFMQSCYMYTACCVCSCSHVTFLTRPSSRLAIFLVCVCYVYREGLGTRLVVSIPILLRLKLQ